MCNDNIVLWQPYIKLFLGSLTTPDLNNFPLQYLTDIESQSRNRKTDNSYGQLIFDDSDIFLFVDLKKTTQGLHRTININTMEKKKLDFLLYYI